jgi:hypothetical protein
LAQYGAISKKRAKIGSGGLKIFQYN